MKFHYAKKFDGDESKLPQREHPEGAVPYREPSVQKLAVIANAGAVVVMFACGVPFILRALPVLSADPRMSVTKIYIGMIASLLVVLPHELLHGICFKEDVYLYTYLKKGMVFVVGPEDMTRGRFIFMSLLPNVVFGLVPYLIGLACPQLVGLGFFGVMCLGEGFGDYINVFNTLTQVPRGALVYLCGFHSFWYLPKNNKE